MCVTIATAAHAASKTVVQFQGKVAGKRTAEQTGEDPAGNRPTAVIAARLPT